MRFRTLFAFSFLTACAPAAAPPATSHAPVASSAAVADAAPPAPLGPTAPVARREPKSRVLHGLTLTDDYAWLRAKGSPEVLAYLNAENAYTDAITRPTAALRTTLYDEYVSRLKETDATAPVKRDGWLYYERTEAGKPYAIHCRKKAPDAPEVVLLDLNEIGKTEKFVSLVALATSDDGNLMAYALDTTGFRETVLRVKDLRTGALLSERIARVDDVAFARDNHTLFYITEDATTKRSNALYRHVLGADPAKDTLVFREDDEMFELEMERSRSKEYLLVTSESKTTTEVRTLPLGTPNAAPRVVAPREHHHRYYVDHAGAFFYVRTDSGGPNFRLARAPVSDPRRASWKEIVPHRADVMLENVEAFADHIVLRERHDANPHIVVRDLDGGHPSEVTFAEPAYDLDEYPRREQNPDFKSSGYRFRFESPITPPSIVEYDVRSRARVVLKDVEVPHYDRGAYETARVEATADDGTKIPVTLVFKRGTTPDGHHPLHLQGYGSYGIAPHVDFRRAPISELDRGVVFAIAHVRGGGDLGKAWHDAGRMMTKMNTFTDFIRAAEYLVASKWAARDAIAIDGRSAGGLLMGAVTNMRPDLWKVVVASMPFVDVMNTMLDTSLPLTVGEFEEWGDPSTPEQGSYMAKYSPYDNIAPRPYPAILVVTSYNDSQVMYWEPAKYVARLRATKKGDAPLLLRTNMEPSGHGGRSNRYEHLRDTAFDEAFLLTQLGVTR